jgi:hypothetical protein
MAIGDRERMSDADVGGCSPWPAAGDTGGQPRCWGVAAQKESVPRIEMTSTSRRSSACCKQVPSGLRGLTPQP